MIKVSEKQKRFEDLSARSDRTGCLVYSDFLGMKDTSELRQKSFSVPVTLWGGYEGAERLMACFGDRAGIADNSDYPIKCIFIEPVNQKFADKLAHRDFLGALINLGIRRSVLGDIVISKNCGYIFCLDTICDYITENLVKVKHTAVKCSVTDKIPEDSISEPENEEFIVASNRLDVIAAAVYSLSRSKVQELFKNEKIYVNGVITTVPSYIPHEGAKISVRGFGRFVFNGEIRKTKKERSVISVDVYK